MLPNARLHGSIQHNRAIGSGRLQYRGQRSRQSAVTYLFDEADETTSESPGLVAITLQRADSDLLRLLHRHRHHMHSVIHQCCIRLQNRKVMLLDIFITPVDTFHHLTFNPSISSPAEGHKKKCVKSRVTCFTLWLGQENINYK